MMQETRDGASRVSPRSGGVHAPVRAVAGPRRADGTGPEVR